MNIHLEIIIPKIKDSNRKEKLQHRVALEINQTVDLANYVDAAQEKNFWVRRFAQQGLK